MRGVVAILTALSVVVHQVAAGPTSSPADQGSAEVVSGEDLFFTEFVVPANGAVPVAIARCTIEPSAEQSWDTTLGAALHHVTAGELVVRFEGQAQSTPQVIRAGAASAEATAAGKTVAARQGDLIVLPAGASATLRNDAATPAATLAVELVSQTPSPTSAGVQCQELVSETVSLPAGRARVGIDRLTLAIGAIAPAHQASGLEVLIVEAGAISLALHPGQSRIARASGGQEIVTGSPGDPLATLEPDPEADPEPDPEQEEEGTESAEVIETPVAVPLQGTVIGLTTGDIAVLTPGSTRTIQGADDGASAVLVVAVSPGAPNPSTPTPGTPGAQR